MRDLSPDENLQERTGGARAPPTVIEGHAPVTLVQFLHSLKLQLYSLQVLNSSGKTMQNAILAQVIRAKSVSRCSTLDSLIYCLLIAQRDQPIAQIRRECVTCWPLGIQAKLF